MAIESDWNEIPNEILNRIIFFLDGEDLNNCLKVNKNWKQWATSSIEKWVEKISTRFYGEASVGQDALNLFRSIKLVKSNYGLVKMIKKIVEATAFGKNIRIQCVDYISAWPVMTIHIKSGKEDSIKEEIYFEEPMDDVLKEQEGSGFLQTVETEYVNNVAVKVDVIFPKGEPFRRRYLRGGPFGEKDAPPRGIMKHKIPPATVSYFSHYLPSDEKNPVIAEIKTSGGELKIIDRVEELIVDKFYSWKDEYYENEKAWLKERARLYQGAHDV